MLIEPECNIRNCVHYQGVKRSDPEEEATEFNHCDAFPDGIPNEIAYGDNKHLKPLPGQNNETLS